MTFRQFVKRSSCLLAALAVPLCFAANAHAQETVGRQVFDTKPKRTFGNSDAGGSVFTQSWRLIDHDGRAGGRSLINAHAVNNLSVKLFSFDKTVYSVMSDAKTTRFSNGSRSNAATGWAQFNGNTLHHNPGGDSVNSGFNATRKTGTQTIARPRVGVDLAIFSIGVELALKANLELNPVAWAHATPTPATPGEQDFTMATAGSKGTVWATGGIYAGVLGIEVGIEGDVKAFDGTMTPGASVTRTLSNGRAAFTAVGNAPANVGVFGGRIRLVSPLGDPTVVSWGNPLTWGTAVFPEERNSLKFLSAF